MKITSIQSNKITFKNRKLFPVKKKILNHYLPADIYIYFVFSRNTSFKSKYL